MAIVVWDPIKYSVKIKSIDADHKKIVDLINDLHDKMKEGKGTSIILGVLDGMLNYTDFHFKREEKFFEMYNYPEMEAHKMEHKNFVEKVNVLIESYKKKDIRISIDTINFLKDWLFNHILIIDKRYSEFLCAKGVQ